MAEKKTLTPIIDAATLARAAGLAKAAQQFPDDVAFAVRSAQQTQAALHPLDDVAAEPWPPMRMRSTT